jgi:hypothetical protein
MVKTSRKAGQNIRELALKRRIKAITCFGSAGVIIFMPFFANWILEKFVKPISSVNSSQSQSVSNFPLTFYLLFLIMALGLIANGVFWWKRAGHASQGAKGEEETAQALFQLKQEGWQIEYGMRLGNRLGDADIVCTSPSSKSYVIDVKSHKGEVTTDGEQLYRRIGKTTYPFEKDFLSQSMKQALQVKKQKKLSFVTPIVTFSDAKVLVPSGKVQKVYVVEKSRLVSLLKSLG